MTAATPFVLGLAFPPTAIEAGGAATAATATAAGSIGAASTPILDAIWLTNGLPSSCAAETAVPTLLPPTSFSSILSAATSECTVSSVLTPLIGDWAAHHLWASARALGLFSILFAGPILHEAIDYIEIEREKRRHRSACASSETTPSWAVPEEEVDNGFWIMEQEWLFFLRNIITAPITEEFVFRGCITAVMLPYIPAPQCHLLLPLFFGLAHFHHAFRHAPLPQVFGQFLYTTLFGCLSSIVLLRTESLPAAIAVHMFCNFMGPPDVPAALEHNNRTAILTAYILGLAGFVSLLSTGTVL